MADLKEFEERIGYEFKDKSLLITSLTHSSYGHEKGVSFNERMEFLGDAVLELVSSEFLYLNYPDKAEGELTKIRASLVCEPTLASIAREIGLGKYIQLSYGENKTGGRERDSVLSDALEATIGAVFLDGGMEHAKAYVERFVLTDIESKHLFYDAKTVLQEAVQSGHDGKLTYSIIKEEGPAHDKTFTVAVEINGNVLGEGTGRSKKHAEMQAAYNALVFLKKEGKI